MSVALNPTRLDGYWWAGWALDLHTVSSALLESGDFDTKRTELGELVYRLKYRNDRSLVRTIGGIAAMFVREKWGIEGTLAAVIPVPPSLPRPFQPVAAVAAEIGQILGLPAPADYLFKTRDTTPLKGLEGPKSRRKELEGAFDVIDQRFKDRHILLFDDLYRSGETLNAATLTLYSKGKADRVLVLALTKTRTKR
jgi:competence protein ComFC